ncbi:MAG: FtsX-like permease family protein [Flavobacteriales bacterium]|nr:FtsX-like permease family protein [Flavobacteriales bacterium]
MAIFEAQTKENIRIAMRAIRGQLLRTTITVVIIALGISSLVAFNTAAEALKNTMSTEFTFLGSNTFRVRAKNTQFRGNRGGEAQRRYDPFTYQQALEFQSIYEYDALVSVSAMGDFAAIVKNGSKQTNPNIQVYGGDENYLTMAGYTMEHGRNFSAQDLSMGRNVVILGASISRKLFDDEARAIDKVISVGDHKYTVIGVLEEKGSSFGFSKDDVCIIPLSTLKKIYASKSTAFNINVVVKDVAELEEAISEAKGSLRVVRKDAPGEPESFEIERSDALASQVDEMMSVVTIGVSIIGILTLIAAGIGLMNILLVSVTERTREIGIRKAIGASALLIRRQFLIESIVIGQIGGAIGILIGIGLGNAIAMYLNSDFTIPWGWIITGVVLCIITSVASGYYPAKKAANLDPIESLRYE